MKKFVSAFLGLAGFGPLYADSGSQPSCSSNFSSPTVFVRCEISGYLVAAQ